MKNIVIKRSVSAVLVLMLVLSVLVQAGCTPGDPVESTPESTPTSSPEATTPEASTPEASTPEADKDYNISYDLDGGIDGGNPTTYNSATGLDLIDPVKPGYDFHGWSISGGDVIMDPPIPAGTRGDLSLKAVWTPNTDKGGQEVDNKYFGKDNGLAPKEGEIAISKPYRLGARGEGIHLLKTVYTDISIDGTMDAAYTYGVHFESDINTDEKYYSGRDTWFDVYMVRGQNGKIYVYIEVVDRDLVVEEYIFKNDGAWRIDSIDMYFEFGNYAMSHNMYSFVPDPTGKLKRDMPEEYSISLTDKGYVIEYAFDNDGSPFMANEEVSVGFYLNDANDWDPEKKKYTKQLMKNSSALNPPEAGYIYPNNNFGIHDVLKASYASASGKVETEFDKLEKTGDMIVDILSGAASVALIYDDNANSLSILMMKELMKHFGRYGADVTTVCESRMDADAKFDYTIRFGKTADEGFAEIDSIVGYLDYGVAVREDGIYVVGWIEKSAKTAYDILYEIIDGGSSAGLIGATYTGTVSDHAGTDVPKLDNYSSLTDVGEDAWQIYKLDSTADEYNAYLEKLTAAGYTKYTENTMATVKCATFVKDGTVVNTQYGGETDRSIRIVVEPLSNTKLPMLEKPSDADSNVTVSKITMMAPQNLCLVFHLSNGHFVIVDSGNNGTQKVLSDFLRKNAPDGKPIVEAWIFTHFHQDHIGGFVDYMGISSMTRYLTVKSVIYNFPSNQVVQTAHKSTTDMNNMKKWYNKIKPAMQEKGTTFYQARTGQKYYFGNAEIEILWTFEDIAPFNIMQDRSNPTCIGFSVTLGGQKIMVTGDSSAEEFTMAYKKYGDYLKSDFVQLSHHGGGDGGSPIEFYNTVGAPFVLIPGNGVWYGAAERETAKNAEKLFVRDERGICTIPLPYAGDDNYESAK